MCSTAVFFVCFFFFLSLNKLDLAGKEGWKEERGRNNSTHVHVLFRSSPPRGCSSALEKTGVEFIIPVPLGVSRWLLIAVIDKPACIQLGMDPPAENPAEAINISHMPHPPYRPSFVWILKTWLIHFGNVYIIHLRWDLTNSVGTLCSACRTMICPTVWLWTTSCRKAAAQAILGSKERLESAQTSSDPLPLP